MKRNFVKFLSPGTLVAEETVLPIEEWDIKKACEMAQGIVERYNARPYAFRFITRERGENELDSHIYATSGLYFLGGTVLTLDEIIAKDDPDDRILISNMKSNSWDRVVVNNNSYRWTQPLEADDVVLDFQFEKETK
jgi:hypothetical protein